MVHLGLRSCKGWLETEIVQVTKLTRGRFFLHLPETDLPLVDSK
jgi:hypothetical protein